MLDYGKLFLFLAIAGAINYLFRRLPFLLFEKKEIPSVILYLGKVLPMAVMCILVLYCIKGTNFQAVSNFVPQFAALVVTALLHIWKRNSTLSIFFGTVCYMVLLRVL